MPERIPDLRFEDTEPRRLTWLQLWDLRSLPGYLESIPPGPRTPCFFVLVLLWFDFFFFFKEYLYWMRWPPLESFSADDTVAIAED